MPRKKDKQEPEKGVETAGGKKQIRSKAESSHPEQQPAEKEQEQAFQEHAQTAADETGPQARDHAEEPEKKPDPGFPVICIGASAGGLEAIEAFVAALPQKSGLSFVVVTHTDPEHFSMLPELIRKKTKAPVRLIQEGMALEPHTIYVPPSDRNPVLEKGVFYLAQRPGRAEAHLPIDLFCKHLANEQGDKAGCIILSGTGSDGTQGLRLIKEKAGLVMAQDRQSARHTGMPGSAMDTGLVDFVLAPAEMPARLIEYFRHPAAMKIRHEPNDNKEPDPLRRILGFMANRTRHDFSLYKTSTLIRRIERRMTVTRSKNAPEYLTYLHHHPDEIKSLFQDLLIGVTSFFRDPESFEALKQKILTNLIDHQDNGEVLRVWIPGCATGEEAFSVAILIKECLEEKNVNREVQIFATDIDPRAIEKARQGAYLQNIAADISLERLKRFFSKVGDQYLVKREIREPVVFAEQNVLRDPPFSGLDLLVCRNLLIYLKSEAQNKLLPLFHYTLKQNGLLFLGSSESVGRFPELFEPLNKSHSLYSKKETVIRPQVEFPTGAGDLGDTAPSNRNQAEASEKPAGLQSIGRAVEKELLAGYTPTCIVVNYSGDIVHIHGRSGKYLEPPPGKFSSRITELAREGLRFPLLSALRRVREKNTETIREHGLRIKINGGYQRVDLTVQAITQPPLKDCLMVILEDVTYPPDTGQPPDAANDAAADSRKIGELELELMRVNQDYRSALEELETSNEELKSTNEEMHSSNEELQSTNEELESSREELQSLNEELTTVNSELHSKIEELNLAYNAITHVLNSTHIALVFLNTDLQVQRFTQEATHLINLIASDIGRPMEHIVHNLEFANLAEKARQVLENLSGFEDEVRTRDGHWYRMSIRVHRTDEHVIEGVVLTFINIDTQKKAQKEIRSFSRRRIESIQRFSESIIDNLPEDLLVLNGELRVVKANRNFCITFETRPEKTEGRLLSELGNGPWNSGALKEALQELLDQGVPFKELRLERTGKGSRPESLRLNARRLNDEEPDGPLVLITIRHEDKK
ncbi:MAG: CheR family methyltransferase [Desulfosarcinaceae bacterium]